MKVIPFSKMHGNGNDFIIIDNREHYLSAREKKLIRKLCQRRLGIGADGLMLIDFKKENHFHLTYFNADGNKAAMCANGARCAVYFMHLRFPQTHCFTFKIENRSYRAEVLGKWRVRIYWPVLPSLKPVSDLPALITENFQQFLWVDSGVPHLVVRTAQSVDEIDVEHWGSFYRHHPLFGKAGTNVNFVNFSPRGILIRTYERGIEGETLSCGTGALAAAWAGKYWQLSDWPTIVQSKGGHLIIGTDSSAKNLWVEGFVQLVYGGEFVKENFL